MSFPILASVLVLCGAIAFSIHRQKNNVADMEDEFWDREYKANSTRRKPLDDLDYIKIPLDSLPIDKYNDDSKINEYSSTIVELSKSPIVNLTGISNTDLKLKYGAPNIDILSTYDGRYTTLASTLQKWALALYEKEDFEAAKSVLEFAVSTRTDVSASYRLLATIYKKNGDDTSIEKLIPIASSINSPLKDSIIEYLKDCI